MYTNIFNLPGRSSSAFFQKIFLFILFIVVAAGLQAQDFEGSWNITNAKGMSGTLYGGEIKFHETNKMPYDVSGYSVEWRGAAANYDGVGLKLNNTLYAGYATGTESGYGIVVYRPAADGNLSGIWTANGFNGVIGSELISGNAKSLDGVFKVSGQNPDGKRYEGTISIRPNGQVYTCTWNIGESTYSGVGILRNGVFAVGYGINADFGLAQYELNTAKNSAKGTWTQAGANVTSYEDIQKQ